MWYNLLVDKMQTFTKPWNIMATKTPRPANLDGRNGLKCDTCSGWGFTLFVTDRKAHICKLCKGSGVKKEVTS